MVSGLIPRYMHRCSMFTPEEIDEIRNVRLHDIIINSTSVLPGEIQESVFFWINGNPCPQPMQLNASVLEPCSFLKGFDYFEVS
jgi:dual oxidase